MTEIASFYDDFEGAMELLKKTSETKLTQGFLALEKELYEKRKQNGLKSPLYILELTLDETSVYRDAGHSLGLPAYQAEMYYQGTGS
jgi:hypothetical protein